MEATAGVRPGALAVTVSLLFPLAVPAVYVKPVPVSVPLGVPVFLVIVSDVGLSPAGANVCPSVTVVVADPVIFGPRLPHLSVSDTFDVQVAPFTMLREHWKTDVAHDSDWLVVVNARPPGEPPSLTVKDPDVPARNPLVAVIVVVCA